VDEITIIGIDETGVTEPRNDGTQGSGLYTVPLILSRTPSSEWGRFFVGAWDRPESFTTMHRSGIASVRGNKIFLVGTTLEEIMEVHMPVLKAAVKRANSQERGRLDSDKQEKQSQREKETEFRNHVREMIEKIKFD
jgi:hypothetical protein